MRFVVFILASLSLVAVAPSPPADAARHKAVGKHHAQKHPQALIAQAQESGEG